MASVGTLRNAWGDRWHIVAVTVQYANRFGADHKKIRQNLLDMAYRAKPLGISHCDSCNMPTVAPTIVRMATVGKLEAEM
jgi:hypothetical protein